jgi:transcriptional regulator with XRE-family HTH domain
MTLAAAEADLSTELSQAIAARVREELARRRLSRQALADLARISISTLEKALAGRRPFTLATTIRLEEALGASCARRSARRPRRRRAWRRKAWAPIRARPSPGWRAST